MTESRGNYGVRRAARSTFVFMSPAIQLPKRQGASHVQMQ